jgi:hypothetical protein
MAFIGNTNTTQAFTPAIDYFSGNGSTTAFTLSRPVASVAQVQVTIDNVAQNPSSAYTVSANTITFTSAPLSGTNNIYVYYTSPITQVIAPGQGTVTSDSFGTITNFTTTGNTVLGDATTDTLTVGVTGIVKDSSGNVGIGGAATNEGGYARVLQVTGSSEAALEVKTGSSYSYFAQNGTTLQIRNNATSGVMTFATEATERMRIDSSGNLLVGTTAEPSASVSGVKITNPGTVATSRWSRGAGTASTNMIAFSNGNGDVGTISTSGSATTYATSSDYRLKNTIAPMTGALAKVALLKPCTYKWNVDGSDGQGFIAHELDEVVPGCVTGEKDAVDKNGDIQPQGIDTSFLVATLTAALQETKALIDTQAETINALTARIVALEGR